MLKIFNTLTRQKEEFKPIHAGEVGMYVCGITVYDLCHIGHGRTFVSFDVVARYLRFLGYKLKYVRNITDIDDKIIKRANENGESFVALVDRMIAEMHKDFDALNILRPDSEPRATHHIAEIIEITEQLIAKGHAYVADNGDVMFDVPTDPNYGLLSRQDLDQLQAGARVDVVDVKRNPMDFVLWKMSKEGEPSWPSPWGAGRPGWHIECSAMNCKQLGNHFDIHGGGSDLMFPHHENEIAQSTCAHDGEYVNYWMHSGMVMVDREKMSKSLGNTLTLSASEAEIHQAVSAMFTDPNHLRVADPGKIEGNVVFTYLDAFHPDKTLVAEMKAHYQRGGLGDRQCKNELETCLQELLAPIRERRATVIQDKAMLTDLLRQGSERAHAVTQQTLHAVKRGLGLPLLF